MPDAGEEESTGIQLAGLEGLMLNGRSFTGSPVLAWRCRINILPISGSNPEF